MKEIELIEALLNGKDLEKNHAEVGSWWHENKSMVSVLRSYVANGKRYFECGGWGSALGSVEARVIELLSEPEKWSVVLPDVQASVATDDHSSNAAGTIKI